MRILTEPHNTSSFKEGLWVRIVISCLVIIGLGTLSGLLFTSEGEWYSNLQKPVFTPPNWIFGPAWILLYILMSASFALIWQVKVKTRYPIIRRYAKRGLIIFGVHFFLNLLWTPLFFGLELPLLALINIILLFGLILFLIRYYFRIDRVAAFLLVPYALWVLFATVLNFAIVVMNG